ncbi:hypothetical protein AAHE18_03G260700 [Arachis hypogaea]
MPLLEPLSLLGPCFCCCLRWLTAIAATTRLEFLLISTLRAEDILAGSRLGNKFRGLFESQVLRSSSTNKERANNVVKIKVVVCFVACFLVGNGLASVNMYKF